MRPITKDEQERLYRELVDLCQQYGFTTEATYDALRQAAESVADA